MIQTVAVSDRMFFFRMRATRNGRFRLHFGGHWSLRRRVSAIIFTISILFTILASGVLHADVVFSAVEWDFGEIEHGAVVDFTLTIENGDDENLEVHLLSTCDCVSVTPTELNIEPDEKGEAVLSFNSTGESGRIEKEIIVRANREGLEKAFFFIQGSVTGGESGVAVEDGVTSGTGTEVSGSAVPQTTHEVNGAVVRIDYFFSKGCGSCTLFLNKTVPGLEEKIGIKIEVAQHDIMDPKEYEQLQKETKGVEIYAFPLIKINDSILQGDDEIEKSLESRIIAVIEGSTEASTAGSQESADSSDSDGKPRLLIAGDKLLLLPVVAAGLLDGVNPCAFTTLIFLLSALAVAGKSRREVLILGMFFTVSVFVTYFLVGLGLFRALRAADSFPVVAAIIRWVLFSVLIIFAGLSMYDYMKIRNGQASEILLQLPTVLKRRIHDSVRVYSRSTALVGSAIILGFLVSVFELACTGQVYFPTIAYLVQVEKGFTSYLFLGIYNLGFILPLVVVFILTFAGISSKRITTAFQTHMGKVKIGTAVLFLALAALTVVT